MRTGITFQVSSPDRLRLERLAKDRNAPQKHVWRASIILLSADGLGTAAIMRRTGKSKTCVWRWQERFMSEGVDGLLKLVAWVRMWAQSALVRGSADERSSFFDGSAYLVAPIDAWQRTDFGLAQASIRLRMATPIAASVC